MTDDQLISRQVLLKTDERPYLLISGTISIHPEAWGWESQTAFDNVRLLHVLDAIAHTVKVEQFGSTLHEFWNGRPRGDCPTRFTNVAVAAAGEGKAGLTLEHFLREEALELLTEAGQAGLELSLTQEGWREIKEVSSKEMGQWSRTSVEGSIPDPVSVRARR